MKPYFTKYEYKKRTPVWIDADRALQKIKKGKRIFIASGCGEPQHLVHALVKNSRYFRDNEIVHILTSGVSPYVNPEYALSFRHNGFFLGSNVRAAVNSGNADYTPIFLSEIPGLFKSGQMPIHAALIQVSPPNKDNFVSLGVAVDIIPAAIMNADIVIAEVNKHMPETQGEALIPLSAIDYCVQYDEPIIEYQTAEADEASQHIGKHLVRYI